MKEICSGSCPDEFGADAERFLWMGPANAPSAHSIRGETTMSSRSALSSADCRRRSVDSGTCFTELQARGA